MQEMQKQKKMKNKKKKKEMALAAAPESQGAAHVPTGRRWYRRGCRCWQWQQHVQEGHALRQSATGGTGCKG